MQLRIKKEDYIAVMERIIEDENEMDKLIMTVMNNMKKPEEIVE